MDNATKTIYGYTQEQLTNIFNEYKNENESIDVKNLQKLLNQEFNKQIETAEVVKLMNIIDKDGNGTLEIDEFFSFMQEREKMEEDEEVLKSTFKVLDTENKGYISPETVYFCFKALGESSIELNDISNVFRWIKNDSEGEGFLNYQDFVSVLKKFDEKTNNQS